MIAVDGDPKMGIQLAPNHVQPEWPNGTPQQIHLDLYVGDIAAAHEEVMTLGARLLQPGDTSAPEGFQVYSDPAGHPYCLCWYRPAADQIPSSATACSRISTLRTLPVTVMGNASTNLK